MNKALQVRGSSRRQTRRLGADAFTQDINIQNMNVELVAQMFKNYQSNVLFHLEGMVSCVLCTGCRVLNPYLATENLQPPS